MGLILDTGVIVRAERQGLSMTDALPLWGKMFERVTLGISVVSLAELAHGIPRADSEPRRTERIAFIAALRREIPLYAIDEEIAMRAGMIDGELRDVGITMGLADALIAATGLVRGDGIATFNVRHFRVVPGLDVVEL
ncbi:MAG: PIN domain-containing protein [Acidobacteriota bacterium]|nr:PIN domain-containing protein [Acidobacteriota bacterium]